MYKVQKKKENKINNTNNQINENYKNTYILFQKYFQNSKIII